jgi:hypothetical protein
VSRKSIDHSHITSSVEQLTLLPEEFYWPVLDGTPMMAVSSAWSANSTCCEVDGISLTYRLKTSLMFNDVGNSGFLQAHGGLSDSCSLTVDVISR